MTKKFNFLKYTFKFIFWKKKNNNEKASLLEKYQTNNNNSKDNSINICL